MNTEPILTQDDFLTLCFSYVIELMKCDIQCFRYTLEGFGATEQQIVEFEERIKLLQLVGGYE